MPELISDRIPRYMKQFKLNEELADQIARSGNFVLFESIMQKVPNANANVVIRTLRRFYTNLRKKG